MYRKQQKVLYLPIKNILISEKKLNLFSFLLMSVRVYCEVNSEERIEMEEIPYSNWPIHYKRLKNLSNDPAEVLQAMNVDPQHESVNHDVDFIYSNVHGYRIPMPKKINTTIAYDEIIQELNNIEVERIS